MTDQSHRTRNPDPGQPHRPPPAASGAQRPRRRRLDRRWLAAGCCAPKRAHAADPIKMGIATDITGAIAPGGNANWQVAQFTVEQINNAGGIGGRQIELFLEDTASDPKIAVGNVRKLIQEHKVDVVLGGITRAMRQAIKDPIVNRGRTLYIYPQLYEGQECTKHLFCTGPTPAQQCDKLIPYLIKNRRQEALRDAVGQLRLAAAPEQVRAQGHRGEWRRGGVRGVLSARPGGIFGDHRQDPRRQGRLRVQHRDPARPAAVLQAALRIGLPEERRHPELRLLRREPAQLHAGPGDGRASTRASTTSRRSTIRSARSFRPTTPRSFPIPSIRSPPARAATGMYRGIKFYEAAVKATNGKLAREEVSAAMDTGQARERARRRRRDGAGQDALQDEHVRGRLCGSTPTRRKYEVIRERHGRSEGMLSVKPSARSRTEHRARVTHRPAGKDLVAAPPASHALDRRNGAAASPLRVRLIESPFSSLVARHCAERRPDSITLITNIAHPVVARDQLRPVLGLLGHYDLRPGAVLRRARLRNRPGRPRSRVQRDLATLPLAMLVGLLLPPVRGLFLLLGRKTPTTHLRRARHAHGLLCGRASGLRLAVCRRRQWPFRRQAAAARLLRVRRRHRSSIRSWR